MSSNHTQHEAHDRPAPRIRGEYQAPISNTLRGAQTGAKPSPDDGFEKLNLIAGEDFGHSNATWSSGLYRGHPTPDWYHFEGWPLRWGLGVLRGMSAAHDELIAAVPASRVPAADAGRVRSIGT